jgi:hypothetical protein
MTPGPAHKGHRLRAIGRRPDDRVQPIRRPWLWFLLGVVGYVLGLLVSIGFGVRLLLPVSIVVRFPNGATAAGVVPCGLLLTEPNGLARVAYLLWPWRGIHTVSLLQDKQGFEPCTPLPKQID